MRRMDQCQGDKEHRTEQELLTVRPWEHLGKKVQSSTGTGSIDEPWC